MCFGTGRGTKRNRVATGCSSAKEVKRFMRKHWLIEAIGAFLLSLGTGAKSEEVQISNFSASQRAGTKLVDITFDVAMSLGTNVITSLAVSNVEVRIDTPSLAGDIGIITAGAGKSIVWDMGADWIGNVDMLSFTLTANNPPLFMVINLSSGPTSTNYPLSYLDEIPPGGWSDSFKTTNIVLRKIPAGSFTMGSPAGELGHETNELQHTVFFTNDFYIGVFEVTQKQWERVMGNWPSFYSNTSYRATRPVDAVNYQAIRGWGVGTNWPASKAVDDDSFMGRFQSRTGFSCFDLPTEAQWEFACRAGTTTALNSGQNLTSTTGACANLAQVGRYYSNGWIDYKPLVSTTAGTAKVGTYLPNASGLYDMHGNIDEWCLDWYSTTPAGVTNPPGPISGSSRVVRGGSWATIPLGCRSAHRNGNGSSLSFPFTTGFRVSGNPVVSPQLLLAVSHAVTTNIFLESRDYQLSIFSERGEPIPPIGTISNLNWGSTVTCSITSVIISGVNWRPSGWTGTGSVPSYGNTNTTGLIFLTNLESTITWNWETSFAITNLSVAQRPGTKLVDITYDIVSDITNGVPITVVIDNDGTPVPTNGVTGAIGTNISPGVGKTIVWNAGTNWNGNAAELSFYVRHSSQTQLVAIGAFPVDTRNLSLTVSSVRGSPSPPAGTISNYIWGSTVTCSVSAVIASGVNWRATSWTGTGSIPVLGTTNTTGPVMLTNPVSSITWNWETSFAITNLVAAQRPGTKLVDITYDIASDVTNGVPIVLSISDGGTPVPTNGITGAFGANIVPGAGKTIVWNAGNNWNGNAEELTFYVRHSSQTQLVASGVFPIDTRAYSLTVASVRGSPSPSVGTNIFLWRATITASVRNVAGYTMTGWSGTGSVPSTGATTNTGPIVLTDLVSSIAWNWTTNDYTVTFDARGGTAPSPSSKVVTYAAEYGELPVTAREYYHFAGWWTDPNSGSLITSNTAVSRSYSHTLFAHWTIYTYPVTLHPGLYGRIAEANSGADYVATMAHGSPFPAVTIVPYAGYSFAGWTPAAPGAITTNVETTAQYTMVSPPTYDVGAGSVVITNSGNYIITGSTMTNTITVATGLQANITLLNVSVVLSNGCAFHVGEVSSVSLTLLGMGTNTFTSCADHAGIHLASNSVLSIMSNSTATLIAQGGSSGAGIGGGQGGNSGSIQIRGGTIQATGGANAAGIGSGENGPSASVVIDGNSRITATGGIFASGIGGGYGGTNISVSIAGNAIVQSQGGNNGGAGIGGGLNGSGGNILIGSNSTVTATGGNYGAGIGGGSGASGGNITIDGNSSVTGLGGDYGAGIGGGLSGSGGIIQIDDESMVMATGTSGGAGIGGGFSGAGGAITINWGTITATATGSAALGAGLSGGDGTISIGESATITAGADSGSAVVVATYNGESYAYIIHRTPGLNNLAATGGNLVFSIDTNGYSGFTVEGTDLTLLPGGAWDWQAVTNFEVNPDGSISVPMDGIQGEIIRLKLGR